MKICSRTPKILGLLLTYPDTGMVDACEHMEALLREERWVSNAILLELEKLFCSFRQTDLLDLQETYVDLFDRTPSLALYLFEHVHGDSCDRGKALVDLDGLYREAGLYNNSEHTPDYLPLFLEYLSMLPPDKAREELSGAINIIAVVEERLKNRKSVYANVFSALKNIAARRPNIVIVKKALEKDSGRPMTPTEIDEAWVEQFPFADRENKGPQGCPGTAEILKNTETQS